MKLCGICQKPMTEKPLFSSTYFECAECDKVKNLMIDISKEPELKVSDSELAVAGKDYEPITLGDYNRPIRVSTSDQSDPSDEDDYQDAIDDSESYDTFLANRNLGTEAGQKLFTKPPLNLPHQNIKELCVDSTELSKQGLLRLAYDNNGHYIGTEVYVNGKWIKLGGGNAE